MRIPVVLIPQEFMDEYKLQDKTHNRHMATCGYFECIYTPGLWIHIWLTVTFTLVVDDFGIKFIGVEQLKHLIESLKKSTKQSWT